MEPGSVSPANAWSTSPSVMKASMLVSTMKEPFTILNYTQQEVHWLWDKVYGSRKDLLCSYMGLRHYMLNYTTMLTARMDPLSQEGGRWYYQSSILCTSPRSSKWVRQGAGNSRPPADHPVPYYELYFWTKLFHSWLANILWWCSKSERKWSWSSPFLHAILKSSHSCRVSVLSGLSLAFIPWVRSPLSL